MCRRELRDLLITDWAALGVPAVHRGKPGVDFGTYCYWEVPENYGQIVPSTVTLGEFVVVSQAAADRTSPVPKRRLFPTPVDPVP